MQDRLQDPLAVNQGLAAPPAQAFGEALSQEMVAAALSGHGKQKVMPSEARSRSDSSGSSSGAGAGSGSSDGGDEIPMCALLPAEEDVVGSMARPAFEETGGGASCDSGRCHGIKGERRPWSGRKGCRR